MEADAPIWCSRGVTALCLNMVGQSTKTFPSRPSSHPEPGGRSVAGGGLKVKELNHPPRTLHPSLEQVTGNGEGGGGLRGWGGVCRLAPWRLFVVEVTPWAFGISGESRGLRVAPVGAVAPPAVTCSQFPCHLAVTFHLLGTEQKHSAGTLQEGGGSDFSATWKKTNVYRV